MAEHDSARMVCVAAVATAHGVRGQLKLKTFTATPEAVAAYGPLFDAAGRKLFRIELVAQTRDGVIVRAEGVSDRNAAERLRGTALYVPRAALPEPEDDEFYYEDLVGLAAETGDGAAFGVVRSVQDYGGGGLVEIETPTGERVTLPFTRAVVPVVDLKGGRIVVEPPVEVE